MSDDIRTSTVPPNRIKVAHLVLGLIFLGITVLWALAESGTVDWHGSRYAVPIILLVAGAAGLVASLAGARRRPAAQRAGRDGPDRYDGPDASSAAPANRPDDTLVIDRGDTDDTTTLPTEENR